MDDRARLDTRELSRAWQGVLGRLELELNPHNFATWLKGTRAVSFADGTLVIEARSLMACDWLDRRMRTVVERAACQAFEGVTAVTFVAAGESAVAHSEQGGPSGLIRTVPPAGPQVIGQVNCSYTFDEYQRGRGNTVAIEACLSVVEPSDLQSSAVVLYGNPGLGKTHLLHALACKAKDAGRTVACLSAEEFTNRYMDAYRDGRANEFRSEMRSVQLLIVDDLQMLSPKAFIQNELVATMEAVKNAGGHVAFASERHPFELPLLERLRSRIGEALITEITPFEAEERRAFVECVARRQRVALPGWAIDRIANCGVASVRVLLGCVRAAAGLEHSQQLDARRLDASMTAVAGADAAADLGEKDLLGRIANYFSVATADVESRKRGKQLSEARNVAAALLHGRGYSLPRVGALLGGRDKSTAHDMVKAGKAVIEERQDLRDLLAG